MGILPVSASDVFGALNKAQGGLSYSKDSPFTKPFIFLSDEPETYTCNLHNRKQKLPGKGTRREGWGWQQILFPGVQTPPQTPSSSRRPPIGMGLLCGVNIPEHFSTHKATMLLVRDKWWLVEDICDSSEAKDTDI